VDTNPITPVVDEDARDQQILDAMAKDGVATEMPVQADYFGFSETHTVMLPDGVSWVQHRTLTEGDRRKYLNMVNKEVRVQKRTGDAILKMAQGDDRYALLETAITGWNLTQNGQPLGFSKGSSGSSLNKFLDNADPKIIDMIEKDIRAKNPWLLGEATVADIEEQIKELEELKAKKLQEAAGNAS